MKFLFLFILSFNIFAEEISINIGDNAIEINSFKGDGRKLIILLPNYRGLGKQYVKWANSLAFEGIDVWALDLHNSYMLSKTKSNMDKFNAQDLVKVVNFAKKQGFKSVYFHSNSRGTKLALKVAYLYQQQNKNNFIKGHIMHSPHLAFGKTAIGKETQYDNIAKYSNLPIYMIISKSSTKFLRRNEIKSLLENGGSMVFLQIIKRISAGFFMKSNSKLTQRGISVRNKLDKTYLRAIKLIDNSKPKKFTKGYQKTKKTKHNKYSIELKKLNQKIAPLELFDLSGNKINIKDYKNKVVLLNFWASWCKPCVREIPSLVRLKEKINNDNFEILTVNIAEEKKYILSFKKKVKFNLKILLDADGVALKDWKVYAYPSNYIIDKNGIIRYGYRGALEWDRKDIIQTINELL